jgi:hypothetical protein
MSTNVAGFSTTIGSDVERGPNRRETSASAWSLHPVILGPIRCSRFFGSASEVRNRCIVLRCSSKGVLGLRDGANDEMGAGLSRNRLRMVGIMVGFGLELKLKLYGCEMDNPG